MKSVGPPMERLLAVVSFPECETSNRSERSMMAAPSSSAHALGRGNAMPGQGLRVIAAVHDELQQMLQEGEGWLAKGKGWDRITSMRQDPHSYNASRLEKVVARLCRCSFWLVRKARSHSKKSNVAPMLRGRKRRRLEHATSSDGKESSKETFGGITALWEGGVEEASLQSTPARHRLGNVRGKFLPLAVGNPIQHAIGLTLGRLMVWSFVNGIPRAAMTGLMTQMTLAGVHLGDKYQDHNAMMTYTGIPVCGSERLPKPHKQSVPTNRQSMPKPVVECRHPVWLSMPCPCRCQCCTRAASW